MKQIFFFLFLLSLKTFSQDLYQQQCHVIGEDDYVKYTIEVNLPLKLNDTFKLNLTAYEDETCLTPYLKYDQQFVVRNIQNESINFETNKITYTALTQETANALNMMSYCQIAGWVSNQETEVTGKKCDSFQQLAKGEILFQIFKAESNLAWIGAMTSVLTGRSEVARPINFDLGFTKLVPKPRLNIDRIPLK